MTFGADRKVAEGKNMLWNNVYEAEDKYGSSA
jgi:hypothetical protein